MGEFQSLQLGQTIYQTIIFLIFHVENRPADNSVAHSVFMVTFIAVSAISMAYITEFTAYFKGQQHFKKLISIPYIGELVVAMVNTAVGSYVHRNSDEAISLNDKDDEVAHLWESILRKTISYMMEDPRKTTMGTYYILVVR